MIGIICPLHDEMAPFVPFLDGGRDIRGVYSFRTGKIGNNDIAAVVCGVGKVNAAVAAAALIDTYNCERVLVSGVAGAMAKGLNIGDTVVVTEAISHDVQGGMLTEYFPMFESDMMKADGSIASDLEIVAKRLGKSAVYVGKTATGDKFIDQEGREDINEKHSPVCVDMETAAIFQCCRLLGVPCGAVRSISDTEDNSGMDNFKQNLALAAGNAAEVVCEYLRTVL